MIALLLVPTTLAAPTGGPPPVRLAVVASSNRGSSGETPLVWSDLDAARVARVLGEVGQFAPGDVWRVPAADTEGISRALGAAVVRASEARARGSRVSLWVYYTGHAAADGLHLDGEVFPLAELKAAARVVPADERVFVVDACQSGQMWRSKGAVRVSIADGPDEFAPPPDEAWIASAGAEENAFEVDQRRGALFTHFFVSGARGAADLNADAEVTLGELYSFVQARTTAEAAGLGQVQQPRWAGALGGVVVSRPGAASSGIVATGPVSTPWLLVDERRGEVLAEVPRGSGARIAAPPGRYQVVALGASSAVGVGVVEVSAGRWTPIHGQDLRPIRGVRTLGGLLETRPGGVSVGLTLATARAPGARAGLGGFLELRRPIGRGLDLGVGVTGTGAAVRAPAWAGSAGIAAATAGLRLDVLPGPWRAGPSMDGMIGVVRQHVARTPDPLWGAWYGDDPQKRRATAPWSAVHAGIGMDIPFPRGAVVAGAGVGPAVAWSRPATATLDVARRLGVEFGGRP